MEKLSIESVKKFEKAFKASYGRVLTDEYAMNLLSYFEQLKTLTRKDIDGSFYKIAELVELLQSGALDGQQPRKLWIKRLAFLENVNNYYRFSVSSVQLFQEAFCKNLDLISKGMKPREDFDDKSHSSAIAFYSHAKVCIESCGWLCKEVQSSTRNQDKKNLLQQHRDRYWLWANYVIEKRHRVTCHPNDAKQMIVGPSGWGSDGKVRFDTIDLENIVVARGKYKLEPSKDLQRLKEYIGATIPHLKSAWGMDQKH